MDAWWTYRPSDVVLYSAETWWRLVANANAELWPAHLVAVAVGVAAIVASLAGRGGVRRAAPLAVAAFALAWLFVAWRFFVERFSTINWAAPAIGAVFAVEAVLLAAWALAHRDARLRVRSGGERAGLVLLVLGVVAYPVLALAEGRSWRSAEAFGIAPDPTALATVGLLLVALDAPDGRDARARRWAAIGWRALLWPIPLAWLAAAVTLRLTMR